MEPHDCTGPAVLTASVHLSLNCPSTLVQETVLASRPADIAMDLRTRKRVIAP